MADNVNAVAGSTIQSEWAIPAEQTAPTGDIGKDEFLKLLVAQLKYQDPLEPQSSDQFIATTAQFTVVEKLDELTKQGANTALINSLTTAGNLVGREVTANRDGVEVTTVVQRSTIRESKVVLETAVGDIALDQVISIGAPPVAVTPTVPTTPTVPISPTVPTTPTTPTDEADETAVDAGDGASLT